MSVSKVKKDIDKEFSKRVAICNRHMINSLPVFEAIRLEQQHAINIIDGLVDKVLDLTKLLITVSVPAIATTYLISPDNFKMAGLPQFRLWAMLTLIVGLVFFLLSLGYKFLILPQYLKSSVGRLEIYNEWLETTRIHAKYDDKKLDQNK